MSRRGTKNPCKCSRNGSEENTEFDCGTPSGRSSVVYGATFLRRSYLDAVNVAGAQPGLSFHLYEGKFSTTHDMAGASASQELQVHSTYDNSAESTTTELCLRATSSPQDGFYWYETDSDDGSVLW